MGITFSNNAIRRLRMVGIAEGISFLILLFIAMPLKYFAGFPLAVKYVGWAHGFLFILYILALFNVWLAHSWRFKKVVTAFGASLIPFGTFLLDPQLRTQKDKILSTN